MNCVSGKEYGSAEKLTGFYQFLAQPSNVFEKNVMVHEHHRYKKKKSRRERTIYYFNGFYPVIGSIHPRSILLKNGIVKKINEQILAQVQGNSRPNCRSYVYKYFGVNSNDYKLYVSNLMIDEAKKSNFKLPQESENIIYCK